jgi:hypothetical protein
MQQQSLGIYIVDDREVVTLEIKATKVGELATFVLDGVRLDPISTAPLTFQFTTSLEPGDEHKGRITCSFPDDAPDDANYQVFVSGSGGGEKFTDSNIKKSDAGWTRGIRFIRPS